MQGFPLPKLKHKSAKLEARKAELTQKLPNADAPPALLHPNMAVLFAQPIGQLSGICKTKMAAPTPSMRGDLSAILQFAAGKQDSDFLSETAALKICYRQYCCFGDWAQTICGGIWL